MMSSPNPTVVLAGSGGVIIDAGSNRWTISPQLHVLVNRLFAAYSANVTQIAYVNDVVWHENSTGSWYQWTGTGWLAGNNPLPVVSDTNILTAINNLPSKILAANGQVSNKDVLIAIQTLTAKVNAMSATQTDIDTNTQTILADVAAINTAVTSIQAEIAALKAANPTIDTTGLDAAVASLGTATAGVQAVPPAAA